MLNNGKFLLRFSTKPEIFSLTFFKTSDAIGTHELTGFVMIPTNAFGQLREIAAAISRTIPAFVLNRSSRVMPGFLGTPAGMITT